MFPHCSLWDYLMHVEGKVFLVLSWISLFILGSENRHSTFFHTKERLAIWNPILPDSDTILGMLLYWPLCDLSLSLLFVVVIQRDHAERANFMIRVRF